MFGDYQLESDGKGDINVVGDLRFLNGVVSSFIGGVFG